MAKRKLTTIFCADVEGYGGLMSRDEEGTLARLNHCRSIMAEHFLRYDGREINTWGDSVIAEFDSVVEAVRCAVDIQQAVETENIGRNKNDRMRFRIGINLGDVVHENGNVYGDGVNMAARLESLADAGGVLISETVHTMVHRQLAIGFDRLEEQRVKNSDEPITGYKVRLDRRNNPEAEESPPALARDASGPPINENETFGHRLARQADSFFSWLGTQPKKVRFSAAMVVFFFTVNLLFSGLATPWFIFPSAPFALHVLMNLRKKENPDEKEATTK